MNTKNLTFTTAVFTAAQQLRKNSFSIYDVTRRLRSLVNDGSIVLSDRVPQDIDGSQTYSIAHEEVKGVFYELIENGILTGLDKRDNGTYLLFFEKPVVDAVIAMSAPSAPPVAPIQSPVVMPTPLPDDAVLMQRVQDYLSNRSGSNVTMKEIQSRFKGIRKTCDEYANLVARLGYPIDSWGRNSTPSRWTVTV